MTTAPDPTPAQQWLAAYDQGFADGRSTGLWIGIVVTTCSCLVLAAIVVGLWWLVR